MNQCFGILPWLASGFPSNGCCTLLILKEIISEQAKAASCASDLIFPRISHLKRDFYFIFSTVLNTTAPVEGRRLCLFESAKATRNWSCDLHNCTFMLSAWRFLPETEAPWSAYRDLEGWEGGSGWSGWCKRGSVASGRKRSRAIRFWELEGTQGNDTGTMFLSLAFPLPISDIGQFQKWTSGELIMLQLGITCEHYEMVHHKQKSKDPLSLYCCLRPHGNLERPCKMPFSGCELYWEHQHGLNILKSQNVRGNWVANLQRNSKQPSRLN